MIIWSVNNQLEHPDIPENMPRRASYVFLFFLTRKVAKEFSSFTQMINGEESGKRTC